MPNYTQQKFRLGSCDAKPLTGGVPPAPALLKPPLAVRLMSVTQNRSRVTRCVVLCSDRTRRDKLRTNAASFIVTRKCGR